MQFKWSKKGQHPCEVIYLHCDQEFPFFLDKIIVIIKKKKRNTHTDFRHIKRIQSSEIERENKCEIKKTKEKLTYT